MSVRKLTTGLLTTLAILAHTPTGSAQNNNFLNPGDPFSLEHESAWFEPIYDADILDMKPEKRANTGYFATIDKLELWASRPDLVGDQRSDNKLDDGSGNRYEIGFMLPDRDEGLLFTYSDLSVGAADTFPLQRINRLNEEGLPGGEAEFPTNPFGLNALIDTDGNNFGFNTRFVTPGRTLNVAEMESYELMKTWRMEPYHYGGILEPMVGFRWVSLQDTNAEYNYSRSFDPIDGFLPTEYFIDGVALPILGVEDAVEIYDVDSHVTENEMLTMQVGFRYFKYAGRTRFSTEFRTFTGMNFQLAEVQQSREITVYDGFDISDDITTYVYSQTERLEVENEEFFIGFDVRSEIGYQLTKVLQVRGGFQLINLATGVWRGGPTGAGQAVVVGGDREQNFLAVGYTFGLEINR